MLKFVLRVENKWNVSVSKSSHSSKDCVYRKKDGTQQDAILLLVEMRGIEPLSENNLTRLSPGAGGYLHSLAVT